MNANIVFVLGVNANIGIVIVIVIDVNTIFNVIGVNVNKVIIFGVNANIVIVIGGLRGVCSRASCFQTLWGQSWPNG